MSDTVLSVIAQAVDAYRRDDLPGARVRLRSALALIEAEEKPSAQVIHLGERVRDLARTFGKPADEVERIVAEVEGLLGPDGGAA